MDFELTRARYCQGTTKGVVDETLPLGRWALEWEDFSEWQSLDRQKVYHKGLNRETMHLVKKAGQEVGDVSHEGNEGFYLCIGFHFYLS